MQAQLALAGRPAPAGPVGAGESASLGAGFDRSVPPLVAWVFSKLQGNLAGTRHTQLRWRERTWAAPSVADLAAKRCLFSCVCWDLGGFCRGNFLLASPGLTSAASPSC